MSQDFIDDQRILKLAIKLNVTDQLTAYRITRDGVIDLAPQRAPGDTWAASN